MLTQTELKLHLHYNHETGIFTRLVSTAIRTKTGSVAGCKTKIGYLAIQINCKSYRSHRLAWLYVHGEFPINDIDHINGIKDDNRISNLRDATDSQNHFNVESNKNNKSGFKGVSFYKVTNKWVAQASLSGKKHNLGYFTTPELASEAYQAFATKHHGEFYHAL